MSGGRIVIAGCGYAGAAVARLFCREGWRVTGLTHSSESAAELALRESFAVQQCDITSASILEIPEIRSPDVIVHCASSGRGDSEVYKQVYLKGARNLAALKPKLLLFTSSTSVYAQTDGEWVTEQSAAHPSTETGAILRETEEFVLSVNGTVARLSGIYGPARSILLRKFLAGEAIIEEDGGRWINQIHRDDIAGALLHLVTIEAQGVFNVSDDTPMTQLDLYTRMAAFFKRPLPPYGAADPNRKRGVTNKKVSNQKLRESGWAPAYPSYFDALQPDGTIADSNLSGSYELIRQDDHGNRFVVGQFASNADALTEQKRLEAEVHKQTFWIRNAPPVP